MPTGATLVANITLHVHEMAHDPYVVVLNGPEELHEIDASSPFCLGTIMIFGHHRHSGPLSFALPLGQKLGGTSTGQRSDGTRRVRIVPLHAAMGHHGMGEAGAVELVAVDVEVY